MYVQRTAWALIASIGAVLLGLPYILHAFGPTEAEVVDWGWVSVRLGVGLGLLALACAWTRHPAARAVMALGYAALALLQVVPIALWFLFHGSGISDGSPPSPFVAHWAYALPHVALLAAGLKVLVHLARPEPPHDRQTTTARRPLLGEARRGKKRP